MRKLLLLLTAVLSLTSCVNNCDYLFTEEREVPVFDFYGDIIGYELVVEDVYECNSIVRDRRFVSNDEGIENLN